MVDKVKQGKRNKGRGSVFELRVRGDLEDNGWVVDKWSNNIDIENNKLMKAKNKWIGNNRPMMMGSGFPDFIAFKKCDKLYDVIGVESKINGTLDKTEKEKCRWLLENNVFSRIYIAFKTKVKNRVVVEYREFEK